MSTPAIPTPTNFEEKKAIGTIYLSCKISCRSCSFNVCTDYALPIPLQSRLPAYSEYYHEPQTGFGQVLRNFGYGDVVLKMIQRYKTTTIPKLKMWGGRRTSAMEYLLLKSRSNS